MIQNKAFIVYRKIILSMLYYIFVIRTRPNIQFFTSNVCKRLPSYIFSKEQNFSISFLSKQALIQIQTEVDFFGTVNI